MRKPRLARRVDIEQLHGLFPKMAKICRHSDFARGYGMTTDCDAIAIPNCELGKPVEAATSTSAAKRTGEIKWHPWQKALILLFSKDLINVRFPRVISLEDTRESFCRNCPIRSVTCKSPRVPIGEAIHVERKKKKRSTGWFHLADYELFLWPRRLLRLIIRFSVSPWKKCVPLNKFVLNSRRDEN